MTTKPKLKKIPLPKGLAKLPKGAVYLGESPLPTKGNVFFSGWCAIWIGDRWDHGSKWQAHGGGYLAAPADSAIAREILGEPAKPVTKRKAAKKAPAPRKLPKNVKTGTKVVCVTGGTGVPGHTDEHVRDEMIYTITDNDLTGMVRVGGEWWWDANRFRLAPAKPAAKKASAARREAIHDCVILEPRIPFVSPPEAQAASNDPVNHPSHYTQGGVECIDAIQSALSPEEFRGYLRGCAMKYLWRGPHKGNYAQDLAKAKWYLDRLAATIEKEKP